MKSKIWTLHSSFIFFEYKMADIDRSLKNAHVWFTFYFVATNERLWYTVFILWVAIFKSKWVLFVWDPRNAVQMSATPPLGVFNHKNINNIKYNKLDKHRLFQISFGDIWLPWKQTNYIFCKLSQSTSAPSSAQSSYEWAYWSNQVPFFVSLSGGTWISFVKSNRQRGEINPM